jgi:hypothetical protein
VLEDNLGEAVIVSFLAIPFIGPILYKASQSFGKVAHTLSKRRENLKNILGETLVDEWVPAVDTPVGKQLGLEDTPRV